MPFHSYTGCLLLAGDLSTPRKKCFPCRKKILSFLSFIFQILVRNVTNKLVNLVTPLSFTISIPVKPTLLPPRACCSTSNPD